MCPKITPKKKIVFSKNKVLGMLGLKYKTFSKIKSNFIELWNFAKYSTLLFIYKIITWSIWQNFRLIIKFKLIWNSFMTKPKNIKASVGHWNNYNCLISGIPCIQVERAAHPTTTPLPQNTHHIWPEQVLLHSITGLCASDVTGAVLMLDSSWGLLDPVRHSFHVRQFLVFCSRIPASRQQRCYFW